MKLERIPNDYLGKCEVFHEDLLYLFYGKPEFRLSDLDALPVSFIFEMPAESPYKVFPFDTGAFHHGLMSYYFTSKPALADFEITADISRIYKIVGHFFHTPRKYYDSQADTGLNIDKATADVTVVEYYNMIKDVHGAGPLDNRRSAIEFIYKTAFSLKSQNVKLVVLPEIDFTMSGGVVPFRQIKKEIENLCGCQIESYSTVTGTPLSLDPSLAGDYYSSISDIVKTYLKTNYSLS